MRTLALVAICIWYLLIALSLPAVCAGMVEGIIIYGGFRSGGAGIRHEFFWRISGFTQLERGPCITFLMFLDGPV